MKLKKLEITGFKSFYDKANIEFPHGISAVVGPNGCGKSNIIDAIRWVMGEQSVKQLRGKAMEDVIFSGTNGKPPLNMAEVSLTLANDNGNAPEELKDFTEINLTRRLYRSGESAYFLNRRPCRLKDIHNVFLGSGVGTKSYAVIQQGNIGAITDASPEERRYFIEEAAGVTRYKTRKIEALRKIEKTNHNLLRVADITAEIKRQMASLKRQARKAELYNTYQQRIRKLDIQLGQYHYGDYARRIADTDGLLQALKDADIGHTSELKQLDAAVEEIKLQRHEKNQAIAEQKQQKFESQRRADRMESDLSHLRSEAERLRGEVAELENARGNIESKHRDMLDEIAQGENEARQISEQVVSMRERLDRHRAQAGEITSQVTALGEALERSKTDLRDLVSQEAQYKNIYQHAASNKDNLARRMKRADEEDAVTRRKITAAESRAGEIQAEMNRVRERLRELEARIDGTRGRLQTTTKTLAEQVKRVQTIEVERHTTRSKIATLRKMEETFEWYRDGVKAVMMNSRGGAEARTDAAPAALKGIISLMADIIEPAPSYETAVEAVLGDALQYILVKDQAAGMAAIDYLQASGAGRSGFIPVASFKADRTEAEQDAAAEDLLINHVQVRDGFQPIAAGLIGHVVFMETLEEAVRRFNQNGRSLTIVTRGGDVVSNQGMLIGGSREKLSGILAKKQELKELQAHEQTLEKAQTTATDEQQRLESEARKLETELQQLLEKKADAKDAETEAEKQLYALSAELKSTRHHLEIIQLEQEQLLGEASDIDAEMTQYHQALADVSTRIGVAHEAVASASSQLDRAAARQEAFNQQVVDLKLDLTALSAKLENSNDSLRRLKEFQADGIKRLEELAREILQKKQKRAATETRSAEVEQSLRGLYREIETLTEALEQQETEYRTIDARLQESDEHIAAIRSKREETLEKLRLLELEQSQRKIKQENIAAHLEDRYHTAFRELVAANGLAPEELAGLEKDRVAEMEEDLAGLKTRIARITDVNLGAIKEYEQLKDRHDFLETQRIDLEKAVEDLHKVIRKINRITQGLFMETFAQINDKLNEVFPRLFNGGTAKLVLTEPEKPLETGVELMIHPPGKKLTRLSLLSGGEKALSAIAFLFAIFLIKPASFCLLDEIDAPLDDANVFRFNDLLRIIGENSQIIMITHNKRSMEFADTLFGITMEQKGVSKVVSVNLERTRNAA